MDHRWRTRTRLRRSSLPARPRRPELLGHPMSLEVSRRPSRCAFLAGRRRPCHRARSRPPRSPHAVARRHLASDKVLTVTLLVLLLAVCVAEMVRIVWYEGDPVEDYHRLASALYPAYHRSARAMCARMGILCAQ